MCQDGAVVRTGGLFSVYQKKQQRPPEGLCIDHSWHRDLVPTGRAARAVASHGGRKEQRGGHGPPGPVQEARGWRGWEGGRQTGCTHSVHSFLMDRFHSQVRWSCLSSSVKKDLL